jgi:predicted MFS family arabinose efflux permease
MADPKPIDHPLPGNLDSFLLRGRNVCWLMLGLLVLARTAIFFQFQSVAALGPFLIDDMGVDFAVLGTMFGAFMLPGVVLALPGGLLGQRFGDRRIALTGLSAMAGGALVATLATTPGVFIGGRIVSGGGAVLLNVLLAKMVADWFAGRNTAVAMAFLLMSWPIGHGIALVTLGPVAETFGVDIALLLPFAISATALLLMTMLYRTPSSAVIQSATFRILLSRREWIGVLLSSGVWTCFNGGLLLVVSFGQAFLLDLGYGTREASWSASMGIWVGIPSLLLGSFFGERLGRHVTTIATCLLACAGIAILITLGIEPWLFFALFGFVIGLPAGLIMKLPVQALAPANRSIGMGIFYACMYAGLAIFPSAAGYARVVTENSAAPLIIAAALFIAATGFLAWYQYGGQGNYASRKNP